MFSVESYVEEVRFNLEKKSNELIESFKALENVRFPEETAVLVVWAYFSLDDIHLLLEAHEDMFDSVHPIEGSDYTYKVEEIEIVKPDEVSVLKQSEIEKELTLVTCHPVYTGTHRLIIRGKLEE